MADNLTKKQRSHCMSMVKSKHTSLEKQVAGLLRKRGIRFRRHSSALPGRPDFVLNGTHVAVFIDGDFWHGYRFSQWSKKLSPFWQKKIRGNIARDRRNFSKLRRSGWMVVRIWGHSVKRDPEGVIERIELAINRP